MIRLCDKHYLELLERWGSNKAIEQSYGQIAIDVKQCEHLDCVMGRQEATYWQDV